jgi:hypothetical protein
MDDAAVVRMRQGGGDLYAVIHHGFRRETRGADQFSQRLALHQLHDDVVLAIEFADLMYSADVGMAERGGSARFVQNVIPRGLMPPGAFR